ncbi:MAG: CbtB-domain containing protein [Verrucomicrobia bacterium]|nr:CbtB-domain containing protein [Verrucomicrobiota bacterium]
MNAQALAQPTTASEPIAEVSRSSRRAMAAVALCVGVFLIWGVGFAQPQFLHDAAHDSRHSLAFPCH